MSKDQIREVKRKPNGELVAMLEEVLEQARAGNVQHLLALYQVEGEGLDQCMLLGRDSRLRMEFIGQIEVAKQTIVLGLLAEEGGS